jgi:hypothetical protein
VGRDRFPQGARVQIPLVSFFAKKYDKREKSKRKHKKREKKRKTKIITPKKHDNGERKERKRKQWKTRKLKKRREERQINSLAREIFFLLALSN